ncbi:hypothetical protein FSP39_008849 [Pinctada imbricata]|uniref:Fibrinogen C-terminal domain-containing protein n=1 Tax=Pinctada imbricata TaxID=66713 RepID=A0AA89BX39_PINIB|nr:hypothetical protein FSP39_008849 [Pinctada imbricata]
MPAYKHQSEKREFWGKDWVFQRRIDGSVDFYRKWADYKSGFGNASGEYWLGNDALHLLTRDGDCILRIDLQTLGGEKAYSEFSNFTVFSENDGYKMTFNAYSGTGGDALSYHKGMQFTTKDKDNDRYRKNCVNYHYGGWWYNACIHSSLNGLYGQRAAKSMYWHGWKNKNKTEYMRKSKMMLQC